MSIRYDQKGKFYTDVISKSKIFAYIQTTQQRIFGAIHVRDDERVSDAVNAADEFLAISDASVQDLQGEVLFETDFIMVNRRHIVWLNPQDDETAGT